MAVVFTAATVRSQGAPATISLCRANVQPCQREVNLLPGQTVDLDLVLNHAGSDALPVAAWETRLKLSNGSAVELVPVLGPASGVWQQDGRRLALSGLMDLTNSATGADAQFFSVQNRYSAVSGELDYAVTLLGFDPTRTGHRVEPRSIQDGLHLGRITVRGVIKGVADIAPGPADKPFQVVGVTASGEASPLEPVALAAPLARINVDPVQPPVSLEGRLELPVAGAAAPEMAVSFWKQGALPPWREGAAQPVAVYSAVLVINATGDFQVEDITEAVVPAGDYDVRVKRPGALSQAAHDVIIPPAAGSNLSFGLPRHGDVNGDDQTDEADLTLLKAGFARLAGDAGYQASADFNADGVVDGQDFSLMALNFLQHGE